METLINEGIRQQPEGQNEQEDDEENEEDELDPRVEIELEKLNKASDDINILEKELDEARAVFRQRLTDATKTLKLLGKNLGNHIDKARPYFESLNQSKKAQADCQDAAVTYEKACQLHKGARDTISIAEEKLMNNPGMFDAAWQEMMNNANARIYEAEKEKLKNEKLHHEATLAYLDLAKRASQLEKNLRKSVNKARPYFEQRTIYLDYLERQKFLVQDLEKQYGGAKNQYSKSLKYLEVISEEIHNKRNEKKGISSSQRGECVGAEDTTTPTRRKSLSRRQSEERIKTVLARQSSNPGRRGLSGLGKYRHSLLLELDVDFDIDEDDYGSNSPKKPTSPGAKSVDIGCVKLKYYDDYQVLDVASLLEKEKETNMRPNTGVTSPVYLTPKHHEAKSRSSTAGSEFSDMGEDLHRLQVKTRSPTTSSNESDGSSLARRSLELTNKVESPVKVNNDDTSREKHKYEQSLEVKPRSDTGMSEFSDVSEDFHTLQAKSRSPTGTSSELDNSDDRKDSLPVIMSMDDLEVIKKKREAHENRLRKDSRPVLISRFSMIEEIDDALPIDALDNLPVNEDELGTVEEIHENEVNETDDIDNLDEQSVVRSSDEIKLVPEIQINSEK